MLKYMSVDGEPIHHVRVGDEGATEASNWWCDMVVVFQCDKGWTRREADRLHNVVN